MITLQNIVTAVAGVGALISTAFGVDWRYIDTQEAAGSAAEYRAALDEIRQSVTADTIEIRLEAARIKLRLLREKEAAGRMTPDERDELEFTLKLIADLQAARLRK